MQPRLAAGHSLDEHRIITIRIALTTRLNGTASQRFSDRQKNAHNDIWIGIDITHLAITLIKDWLQTRLRTQVRYQVTGEPMSLPDAEVLAAEDPYQLQWKVALTACVRKLLTILNAMVKHHTPWHPEEVPRA